MAYHFGEKIREVRERRRMTIKEVAARASLSESLISQIERNRVSPAIDTLLKIIDILDIDLDFIFSDFKKDRSAVVVRKAERQKISQGLTSFEQLSRTPTTHEEHGIEAFYLEILPGGESGGTAYGHIGMEMGILITGSGDFHIGNKVYQLSEGDSISFTADVPHMLKNTGNIPLKAFWVITPPKKFGIKK